MTNTPFELIALHCVEFVAARRHLSGDLTFWRRYRAILQEFQAHLAQIGVHSGSCINKGAFSANIRILDGRYARLRGYEARLHGGQFAYLDPGVISMERASYATTIWFRWVLQR